MSTQPTELPRLQNQTENSAGRAESSSGRAAGAGAAAEKEAFTQRQMDLLKKPDERRGEYLYTDGRGCRAPQVKGERRYQF